MVLRAGDQAGLRHVEDITGDDERVDGRAGQLREQPLEERGVLGIALASVQRVAQVPVGRVQDAHGREE